MNEEYKKSVEFLFEVEIPIFKWNENEDALEFLVDNLSEFNYFRRLEREVSAERAKSFGKKYESVGDSLYNFSDDPDFIQFIAMKKGYEPLLKALRKILGFQEISKFNAVDFTP